jgi:hypothetical protein
MARADPKSKHAEYRVLALGDALREESPNWTGHGGW